MNFFNILKGIGQKYHYQNFLILDCLKFKKHPGHFNLETSLKISSYLKPKKTILTNLHNDLDYDLLKKELPNEIEPAFDGLNVIVN